MKNKIKIGGRPVGQGEPVFIIAEVGSNHNRDLKTALKMIGLAADAGVDAVKFQTYSAGTLYSKFTPRLSEMKGRSKPGEGPYDLIKRIEMPRAWHQTLMKKCRDCGVLFSSSPFDLEAVRELDRLNVPFFKIASYETDDFRLLKAIGSTGKPVIISTGNSDLKMIREALGVLRNAGSRNIILLHCVSQYPAVYRDLNLRAMGTLKGKFKLPVGFSDHTLTSLSAIAAVALGACVIEKHFTLNKKQIGPDHPFSLEPAELKEFVANIRKTEQALGSNVKKVLDSERENFRLARRSLHAAYNIKKGTKITPEMLVVKRPGLGIKSKDENRVVGKVARTDIKADQWITEEMI
ncbi:MAG: N-acetylneuraminate synthase family protein [Candidatus Peribacteraceae bacterium]